MGNFLRKRGRKFHFRRRIPKHILSQFDRDYVQVPLHTDSRIVAVQRASNFNLLLEDLFIEISDEKNAEESLKKLIANAKKNGFQYLSSKEVIETSLSDFVNRINIAAILPTSHEKRAILGANLKTPSILLSEALVEYFEHEKGNLIALSDKQFHKWKNPRKSTIENFIKVIGDKPITEITRKDILNFRAWWIERVTNDNLSTNSANKQMGFLKQIIKLGNNNYNLEISVDVLFKEVRLKEVEKNKRYPLSTNIIEDKLFKIGDSLNTEARLLIFAMADTGARIGELTGLEEQDIILNDLIPHIKIRPNATRTLKTPQSERDIPLVGASLYAFKKLNGTFNRYFAKPSLISTTINKYCRENFIFKSKHHSLYSLRHTFEDRLTAVEPPDKVQAALMGHKYIRPRYGAGPSLEQKRFWLDKIAFQV